MTVTIGKNGFSVTQGMVTADRAFDNLKKIEGVLRDNIPTASRHESAIKDLMLAAKENRDILVRFIKTDTVFEGPGAI